MSDVNMEQMPDLGRFVDYVWSLKTERNQLRAERDSHQRLCIAEMEKNSQLRAELAEYQEDPSYVTACETIRKLRAELEAIRGQQPVAWASPDVAGGVRWSPGALQQLSDGSPLYALPPQQPDAWPTLDKPAKVGAVLFNPGLSARLVVEAAQRQHEYSQQPEIEAARLERFGAFMREVHGENGDGGASDGP